MRTIEEVVKDIDLGTWGSDTEYRSEEQALHNLCNEILEIHKGEQNVYLYTKEEMAKENEMGYDKGFGEGVEAEQEETRKLLAKIRAEIKGWQDDIHDNENDADEHDFVFERIFEIFDEYTTESEGKE